MINLNNQKLTTAILNPPQVVYTRLTVILETVWSVRLLRNTQISLFDTPRKNVSFKFKFTYLNLEKIMQRKTDFNRVWPEESNIKCFEKIFKTVIFISLKHFEETILEEMFNKTMECLYVTAFLHKTCTVLLKNNNLKLKTI